MTANLYISHDSALHYWRTNPPGYVLDGADREIRVLKNCPTTRQQVRDFYLSELEFGPDPIDVLIPPGASMPSTRLRYHVQKAPIPVHTLYPLRDGIFIVSPALCFVQLCKKLTFIQALTLGMELCGTYALRPDYDEGKAGRDYRLLNASSLERTLSYWRDIHGLRMARKVAKYLNNGSNSPMETKVYCIFCLPLMYGGYNLKIPEMNNPIKLVPAEMAILRQTEIRPDFLWRKERLLVEYDGEYHNDPYQIAKDDRRKTILESRGYTVRVLKKQQLYNPALFQEFMATLQRDLGTRKQTLTLNHKFAREKLRKELLG